MLKLLNFSCSRCSFPSDHSDHFLVNINKAREGGVPVAPRALGGHEDGGPEWGDRAVREDLHHRGPYPF